MDAILLQNKLFRLLETEKVFRKPIKALTLDETRRLNVARMKALAENDFAVRLVLINLNLDLFIIFLNASHIFSADA